MFKFIEHTGVVVPLNISNIDTDAIIPKQFLKKVNKIGFGKYLFHDWRFLDKNQLKINPNFILNKSTYKNASILLTRENFGCGSSREHAVWSLLDYGFKVIIASSFSDIFYSNSFNNKLLLIVLENEDIDYLFDLVNTKIGLSFNVSLIHKKITVDNLDIPFQIDDFQRLCLVNNWDNNDLTMKIDHKIKLYEKNIFSFLLKREKFTS
uniref:3-isopropylmalate dehydratase small subunit n=1 Tax=Buchnera aphidicola subsp. Schizaphis graminum (strain Sg) TaxID=198804 RepID=LEUD_BUCAP|nr:3-isopropylmalate dehydratase small subunit [Buchnera aphidicola]O85066.1 RecName: Full=3-isopropylmalate dehydratase small subunit; AltName: Full=Alpha-IPM isomerase; Short=IPMI; AltName: Full=Isopropylmalate isomerase [Buchnera aphidicola str. Sg (Schizaphis graminum)]AAD12596.1 isopropylmalate isomerase subunit [Buchnera aphidicola (Schizaphis graminum)]